MAAEKGSKNKVVIGGYHPEMELIHTMDYDNSDPHLKSRPRTQNLEPNNESRVDLKHKRPK